MLTKSKCFYVCFPNLPGCFLKLESRAYAGRIALKQKNGRTFNGSSVAGVVFSLPLGVQTVWNHAGDTGSVGVRRQKFYLNLQTRTPRTSEWQRGASTGLSQNNNF